MPSAATAPNTAYQVRTGTRPPESTAMAMGWTLRGWKQPKRQALRGDDVIIILGGQYHIERGHDDSCRFVQAGMRPSCPGAYYDFYYTSVTTMKAFAGCCELGGGVAIAAEP